MRMTRLVTVALTTLAAVGVAAPQARAESPLSCAYRLVSWPGGFIVDLSVTNRGPAIDGWTVRWSFPVPTQVTGVWQARMFQPDPLRATAMNMAYNPKIPTGSTTTFGWSGTAAATGVPTDVTVNDAPCP